MSDQSNSVNVIDPLEFLKRPRSDNKKRQAETRRIDFKEIYEAKPDQELATQAARCLDCGNPYCEWKCPLHNYIPNWLELTRDNHFEEAAELMHQTNPLPEICGRVCPQDRLCEQACTLHTGFGAVNIGAIEKNISDKALESNWRPDLSEVTMSDKRVAIIGAGPAGLGCAELLARNGVKPVVFDKYPEIGGLLTFGIPGFKLEKGIIRRRRQFLEDIGVEFRLNIEVGKEVTIDKIEAEYDAVFLAMGCYNAVTGNLKGSDSQGVIKALDFLIGNVNQQENYAMKDYAFHDLKDKRVIVLGGGDTAMDCVRSAIRHSAKSVACVYRRDKGSMPGSPQEVKNAEEEGVEFIYNLQPMEIRHNNGQLKGVEFAQTEFKNTHDASRSQQLTTNKEKQTLLEADIVILAFGFQPSPASWFDELGLKQGSSGLVKTLDSDDYELDYSQKTDAANIYAGGDMVRGADLVVTAIAEGRQAAREILAEFAE